jgi:RimJ/RimL family protein N-acetyltransferase
MDQVEKKGTGEISHLFEGIDDSMVIACLRGYQGTAYVDSITSPKVGLIVSGEYSFWGGDPNCSEARDLVHHVFSYIPGNETTAIFSDDNAGWMDTLLSNPINRPQAMPRFGIVQRDYDFDIAKLVQITNNIPSEYHIMKFDSDIYHQAMSEAWSSEFCETFLDEQDYLSNGFGFAATIDGNIIAGASTMTIYDKGTEIQVATRVEHRGKGLALACAAQFILECLDRKLRPHWDAANETSLHMALKLGYEYKGEYTTIKMIRPHS